eukprot:GHVT01062122.1.p1 GENE.GHVT01062122.1~~GHVT01062122.1.p1  ORF type:complete len:116 (+),score=1.01 GHVT01062122.1:612-959(+)
MPVWGSDRRIMDTDFHYVGIDQLSTVKIIRNGMARCECLASETAKKKNHSCLWVGAVQQPTPQIFGFICLVCEHLFETPYHRKRLLGPKPGNTKNTGKCQCDKKKQRATCVPLET